MIKADNNMMPSARVEEPYAGQPLTAKSNQGPAAGGLAPVQAVAVPAASEGDATLPPPAAASHLSQKQPAPLKTEADMAAHPQGSVNSSQRAPVPKAAASMGNPLARGVQAVFDGYAGCCGRMHMHVGEDCSHPREQTSHIAVLWKGASRASQAV